MHGTITDLGRWRDARRAAREQVEMRVAVAARRIAVRLMDGYRTIGAVAPGTLGDAARRLENTHHRALAPKLTREITDAIAAGVAPAVIAAALHEFADAVAQAATANTGRAA